MLKITKSIFVVPWWCGLVREDQLCNFFYIFHSIKFYHKKILEGKKEKTCNKEQNLSGHFVIIYAESLKRSIHYGMRLFCRRRMLKNVCYSKNYHAVTMPFDDLWVTSYIYTVHKSILLGKSDLIFIPVGWFLVFFLPTAVSRWLPLVSALQSWAHGSRVPRSRRLLLLGLQLPRDSAVRRLYHRETGCERASNPADKWRLWTW